MATIQLLVLMLNNSRSNNLVLTTHSPYTLTVINNLIYAAKIGEKNPEEVGEIVNKLLWLPWERVDAYRLQNGRAENILDQDLHEIKAELIDDISRTISEQYSRMLDIETVAGDED